jgi:phage FluMu gp28-like protein
MNLMLFWLLGTNKQKGGWVSPVYSQCKNVFEQMVIVAKDIIKIHNKADLSITFINGSTLKFLSSDSPDSIRGFRFTHLILDETAFIKENAITEAILPTLNPTGKKCLMISTPKSKNHFFTWYNKGLSGSDTISFKIPLTECPYLNEDLINEARLSLPDAIFKQEYMAEFSDAGSEVFRGIDEVSILNSYNPFNKHERCFIGIDTGISSDYSVLTVMNEVGIVQNMVRINGENIQVIADRFISVLNSYNIAGGYIETNGIGRAMADLIIPKFRNIKEFTTTQDSKTQIVRTLIEDIEQQRVELPSKELMPELYKELNIFTYRTTVNGKLSFGHPTGMKDDCVDSLMLANASRGQIKQLTASFGKRKMPAKVNPVFGVS